MENKNTLVEQNRLIYESLKGQDKVDFYTEFFQSQLVLALRLKRKAAKLSQEKIAERMGVKQSYVSKIENLEKSPTIETLAKYLHALNYDFEEVSVAAYQLADIQPFVSETVFIDGRSLFDEKESNDTYMASRSHLRTVCP